MVWLNRLVIPIECINGLRTIENTNHAFPKQNKSASKISYFSICFSTLFWKAENRCKQHQRTIVSPQKYSNYFHFSKKKTFRVFFPFFMWHFSQTPKTFEPEDVVPYIPRFGIYFEFLFHLPETISWKIFSLHGSIFLFIFFWAFRHFFFAFT